MSSLFRRKVLSSYKSSPWSWGNNYDVALTCGHVVTAGGIKGEPPKTVTCYKCRMGIE